MSNIIEQMSQWDNQSILIYLISISFATIFAFKYQKTLYEGVSKKYNLCLSFLSIWVVIAFSSCGADYTTYKIIFENSLDIASWSSVRIEKGYIVFNALVRVFTDDFRVFHAIWAFVMLFMTYKAIIKFENEINIWIAVLTFSLVYLFQSMNLMRLYFTMSIMMLGFWHYLKGNKRRYLAYLFFSFFFHRSAVILFMPFLFSVFFKSKKRIFFKVIATVFVFFLFYYFRNYIFSTSLFDNAYNVTEGGFGISNIIYHIPLVILFYYAYKSGTYDSENLRCYFLFFLTSFFIGAVSYFVSILGRAFVYFSPLYMFFPAYVLKKKDNQKKRNVMVIDSKSLLFVFYVIFVIFRAFMMTEYFFTDMIMPYTSIFMR